jgi:hypothetical protein
MRYHIVAVTQVHGVDVLYYNYDYLYPDECAEGWYGYDRQLVYDRLYSLEGTERYVRTDAMVARFYNFGDPGSWHANFHPKNSNARFLAYLNEFIPADGPRATLSGETLTFQWTAGCMALTFQWTYGRGGLLKQWTYSVADGTYRLESKQERTGSPDELPLWAIGLIMALVGAACLGVGFLVRRGQGDAPH